MTPEIQEMVDELKKEGATYYQVRVVVNSITELSSKEKLEILKEFLPPEPVQPFEFPSPTKPPPLPEPPFMDRIEEWAVGVQKSRSYPFLKTVIFWVVKWGLIIYFSYYALWAVSRFLNEWILKI